MRTLIMIALILSSVFLTACSREPGEPQREPGTYFRTGGDVCTPSIRAEGRC